MKKLIVLIMMLFILVGCEDGNESLPIDPIFTVTIKNKEITKTFEYELNEYFDITILDNQETSDTFEYWYYIKNNVVVQVNSNILITEDITIIAKYEDTTILPEDTKLKVTIVNKQDSITYEYELNEYFDITLLNNQTTDETFKYWYYIEDSKEVQVSSNILLTKSITIYAKYEGTTGTLPWV